MEQLFLIFSKTSHTKRAYRKYCTKPDETPYSIEDYIHIISKQTGKEIDIQVADDPEEQWDPKCFKGSLYSGENKAIIVVPALKEEKGFGVTKCEQRFAIIKEACQILIENNGAQVDVASELVRSIVNAGSTIVLTDQKNEALISEYLAEFAALELLFPDNVRQKERKAILEGDRSPIEVAKEYRIPLHQLMRIVDHDNNYALEENRERWQDILSEGIIGLEVSEIDL